MIVYAVYIISQDGRTILTENFQSVENITNQFLLGGLLTALQSVADAMTGNEEGSELKSVKVEGLSYHIQSFGLYRIVLVTDVPKSPENLLQMLGLRFMKQYGEELVDKGGFIDLQIFSPFIKVIRTIISEETISDESKSLKPAKRLGTSEIFSLPHNLQATALGLVSLQEGTTEQIAEESGKSIEITEENLAALQKMGFVGVKKEKDRTRYFCNG